MNKFKFCVNCGKKIRSTTQFCPYCGTKQPNNAKNVKRVKPTMSTNIMHHQYNGWLKSNKHKVVLAIIIIFILIVGFVSYQHSEMSINLNNEIPNDSWTLKSYGSSNPHDIDLINDVHFNKTSTSGHISKSSYDLIKNYNDLKYITIKPTGRRTATFYYHGNDADSNVSMTFPMKVTGGNEKSLTLSYTKKASITVGNGHRGVIKNNKLYMDGKKISMNKMPGNNDFADIFNTKMTLTKD